LVEEALMPGVLLDRGHARRLVLEGGPRYTDDGRFEVPGGVGRRRVYELFCISLTIMAIVNSALPFVTRALCRIGATAGDKGSMA
jgi:hypothetical protein